MTAEIHTAKGLMKVEFYQKDAPNTKKDFMMGSHFIEFFLIS